ncbi:EAL domain-containing protein [Alteromonas sp. KUL106]|uniref:EAL domain-containing protein n=1 Tax=Alteromonas sp. KUL106 TaxID=2480799 RepID=UPI0012E51F66|nr:EAL domain-containing protein [Alteromonas sp. KUL106]GFD68661.1 hypothetical protein KUL106_19240 [Alteromonas sp. KUL106]
MYLDTQLYSLIRKFKLFETLSHNDNISSLMQKCINESALLLPNSSLAVVKTSKTGKPVLMCSSHDSLPMSIEKMMSAAEFLKQSREATFTLKIGGQKLHFDELDSNIYLCVTTDAYYYSKTLAERIASISTELSILLARSVRQNAIKEQQFEKSQVLKINEFGNFYEELKALFSDKTPSRYSAMIFIDFERFSSAKEFVRFSFNDDMLLLIQQHVNFGKGENVKIARVEHDLLAVLMKDIAHTESLAFEHVTKKIQHFRRKLKDHITIDSQKFFLTFKAGIRLFKPSEFTNTSNAENAKTLIQQTEFAMDLVTKDAEVPYLFFTDELLIRYKRRIAIKQALKFALQNDEFYLAYQPIYDDKKIIIGAEALLRWESKLLGNVSPGEFIPVAEQSGLVIDIGNLVAEQVCKALNSTLEYIDYVSMNVSCIQLKDSMYSDKIEYLMSKYPKSRGRLRIEITESVAMTHLKRTRLLMSELKEKGIQFMLDDFGTGHSSLAYLNELPLSTIKIDRCFVDRVSLCEKKQAIVGSIKKLAQSFNLNCVAEGIESESDFTYLKNINIDSFQGFLLSKPLTEMKLSNSLKR